MSQTAKKGKKTYKKKSKKDAYEIVTNFVIDGLEKGFVPWKCPFFSTAYGNPLTGNYYKKSNPLMLALYNAVNGLESNQFVTKKGVYSLWKRTGSFLKIGKSCPITYFSTFKVDKDKDGNPLPKEDVKNIPMIRWYSVYNLDQLTDEAKELVQQKSKLKNAELDNKEMSEPQAIWDDWTDKPKLEHHSLGEAWYSPSMDLIKMPNLGNFFSSEEYYSTLFHEAAHSTGHESRWEKRGKKGRFKTGTRFGDHDYSYEELVAEISAAMLCQMTGIETTLDNSKSYLLSWASKLKNNKKWIIDAASDAQMVVDIILNEHKTEK